MTLQECYALMGADFDDAISRLRSEKLLQKFVLKFLDDGSFDLLCDSMKNGNNEEAFRAAHTIKGMCQNLSFTVLAGSSSKLTEDLRNGGSGQSEKLFADVRDDYRRTVNAINSFKDELEA